MHAGCCARPAPELNRLPTRWLRGLLQRVRAPGQSRDDIVRRSAGLPYAFVALFLAEPPGPNKVHQWLCTALTCLVRAFHAIVRTGCLC